MQASVQLVDDRGRKYLAAVLGHADIATTAIYTTALGVEARGFLAKMWG